MPSFISELTAITKQSNWLNIHSPLSTCFHWVMLTSGETAFHDNVLLLGFNGRNSTPIIVAKACRLPENGWMLQAEFDHLQTMWKQLGEYAPTRLPKPLAIKTIGKQPALITNYLPGESLQKSTKGGFWHDPERITDLVVRAAKTLREIHDLASVKLVKDEIILSDFNKKADTFLEMFGFDDDENQVVRKLISRAAAHSDLADTKVMIHGDFWHGNIIRREEDDRFFLIDWQFARWAKDASMDVYLFPLAAAVAMATESGGTETVRAELAADILNDWQNEILPAYFTAYGKPDSYALLPPRDGMLICCIEKAARSLVDFGRRHQDDLLWRALFGHIACWPDREYTHNEK